MEHKKRKNLYSSYTMEEGPDGSILACFNRVSTTQSMWFSQGSWAVEQKFEVDPVYKVNRAHLEALLGLSHGTMDDRQMLRAAMAEMNAMEAKQKEPPKKKTWCGRIASGWRRLRNG